MTAVLLKLVNGDEIIGDIDLELNEKHTLTLSNPLIIETKPNNNGAIAFILNKYISFSAENRVTINVNNIIAMTNISEDMENYWKANVEYVNSVMVPVMELNIKRGLQYFTKQKELVDEIENDTEDELTEDEFMEELLKELEPPSKLKH